MLETDEVDIDYFTPAGNTSLASIFGKGSEVDDTKENTSLKYVPLPPPEKSKPEEVKPTQWIFTCAVHGFEWINSAYVSKGKLGFAILRVVKNNSHSIILYDSNKTTVSYATISSKLNIHMRDVLTISYYDNAQKYWSIKTSEDDMHKILHILKDLQVTFAPNSFPEIVKEDIVISNDNVSKDKQNEDELKTDTDFSINQKTKDTILKRMANMGHSVLPIHDKPKRYTSESSDSSHNDDRKKNIRHKPTKLHPKKYADMNIPEKEANFGSDSNKLPHNDQIDGQTPVLSKSDVITPCTSDMNIFISEQKISNSELRINVNRVSDKLDVVLERLNEGINTEKSHSFLNFQNDIVQKLIKEYESKIKNYEYIMSSKGIDFHTMKLPDRNHSNENPHKDNVVAINEELQNQCKEKDSVIKELENEVRILNEKSVKINEENQNNIKKLQLEIEALNENLNVKNSEIENLKKSYNNINPCKEKSGDVGNKVKKIMNDTFEAISVNFDDMETYSGETIKAIIAIVIKKTTIQALQEL